MGARATPGPHLVQRAGMYFPPTAYTSRLDQSRYMMHFHANVPPLEDQLPYCSLAPVGALAH